MQLDGMKSNHSQELDQLKQKMQALENQPKPAEQPSSSTDESSNKLRIAEKVIQKLKGEVSKLKEENEELGKSKGQVDKLNDEIDSLQFKILEEQDKSSGLTMKLDGMKANFESEVADLKT